jgi:hypothetical protein
MICVTPYRKRRWARPMTALAYQRAAQMEFKTAMGEPLVRALVTVFRLSPLHGAIGGNGAIKHEEKPQAASQWENSCMGDS